jgi:hypothetical protein
MAEKNLEVKFLTLWIDEKQRWSRRIEKTRIEKKDYKRESFRRKKI